MTGDSAGEIMHCRNCEEREATEQGFCEECIETGEKILESPLTGNKYRVTRWVEQDDGHIISLQKEAIDDE